MKFYNHNTKVMDLDSGYDRRYYHHHSVMPVGKPIKYSFCPRCGAKVMAGFFVWIGYEKMCRFCSLEIEYMVDDPEVFNRNNPILWT